MFASKPMHLVRAVNIALVTGMATLPFAVALPADPEQQGVSAANGERSGKAPVTALVGHVSDGAGAALPDVRLHVAMLAGDMPDLSLPLQVELNAKSNSKGDYRLELPAVKKPTTVSIVAIKPRYLRFSSTLSSRGPTDPPVVAPGVVTQYSIVLESALYVAGVVTDQKGSPIPGARIAADTVVANPVGDIEKTETHKDGSFELFNYPLNPVQGDGVTFKGTVLFSHPNYVEHTIDDVYALVPKQRQSLRIVLTAGHSVTGKVLDVTGKPVSDAMVVCHRPDGTKRKGTRTDSKGKFALRGIADGTVVVEARALAIKQKARLQMAVKDDANDLVIRLQAIKFPGSLKKYNVLGMQLVDVTPELKSAYDLQDEYGALVLDPGVETARLGLDDIAAGCNLCVVGDRTVVDVAQFLRQTLAMATRQTANAHKVHVVYVQQTPDFEAGMNRYLRLTNRDIDHLQTTLDQLTSEDEEVIAALRRGGAQFQFAKVPKADQRNGSGDGHVVSAIILGKRWKGSDGDLRKATTLSTLQVVYVLGDGRLSDKALEDMRKTERRVVVERVPKSSLGILVEGPAKEGGLEIRDVFPDSPAARAGLRSGDCIVEFAGAPVADLEGLHKLMSPLKQGQRVVAKALRSTKTVSVNIEVGKWD